MARLWRLVTAAFFVTHLMLGCCAHHSHAAEGQSLPLASHGAVLADGQCIEGHDGPADPSHRGPSDCRGGSCSFLRPSPTVADSPIHSLPAVCVPLLHAQSLGKVRAEQQPATGGALLSVRLHLVHQVLLI